MQMIGERVIYYRVLMYMALNLEKYIDTIYFNYLKKQIFIYLSKMLDKIFKRIGKIQYT